MEIQTVEELAKLDRSDLLKLQSNVAAALIQSEKNARAKAKQEMDEIAQKSGFTVAELYGLSGSKGGKRGSRAAGVPKFRHPENPELTWTGQGRKPKWIVEHVESGGSLDDLAI